MRSKENIEREIAELRQGLGILKIDCNQQTIQRFRRYIEILYKYKGRLHLISHRDHYRISKRHFLTSLLALPYIKKFYQVCDIGAGAGFPSVPIKIVKPEINFTLFESKKKKADFLNHLINELGLCGIEVINKRAEHYRFKKFDLILIKAAGGIKKLLKTIDFLTEPDGCAIFFKSPRVEYEIKISEKEIKKRRFLYKIIKVLTPIENSPLMLVFLKRIHISI